MKVVCFAALRGDDVEEARLDLVARAKRLCSTTQVTYFGPGTGTTLVDVVDELDADRDSLVVILSREPADYARLMVQFHCKVWGGDFVEMVLGLEAL